MNNSNNIFNENNISSQQPNNTLAGNNIPSQQPNNMITETSQPFNNKINLPSNDVFLKSEDEIVQSNNNYNQPINNNNNNNINNQSIQSPPNPNLNILPSNNTNIINDEELLRAFIGKNYDKITTKLFNFAGLFFNLFYMFYRKMFLYGVLLTLINLIIANVIKFNIIIILLDVIVGFFVNKLYVNDAKKKIEKIKLENPTKTFDQLKNICVITGGTSVKNIFLGLISIFVISYIMTTMGIGNLLNNNFGFNSGNIIPNIISGKENLVKNAELGSSMCINNQCTISIIDKNDNYIDCVVNNDDREFFQMLIKYYDYVKIDVYYISKGNTKTLSKYKLYLKSTSEDISNIKTVSELREKIGLYQLGTHTDVFTLTEIGQPGFGIENGVSYTFITYYLVDSKNIEYEMKYKNPDKIDLIEGKKYTITFEVLEDKNIEYDYEYNIKEIK